jgi:redox-sensing transcriptional repressor
VASSITTRGTKRRRGRRPPDGGGRRGAGRGRATGRGRITGRARGGGPISDLTAQRLSVYLRCLDDLEKGGVATTSSQRLADLYALNSAQIRKDLAQFGEFGVRGVGYTVGDLRRALARILGLTREWKVVIVGAGNLGMALADYGGFNREGFTIVGLFDSDAAKVGGRSRGGVPVHDIRDLPAIVRREQVSLAVLAVPATEAEGALDRVERAGLRGILNFAPIRLRARPGMTIKAVDLKVQLENLVYHVTRDDDGPAGGRA